MTTDRPQRAVQSPAPAEGTLPELISRVELMRRLGVAKSTIPHLVGLPAPYRLSAKVIRWDWAEVFAWLKSLRPRTNASASTDPRA